MYIVLTYQNHRFLNSLLYLSANSLAWYLKNTQYLLHLIANRHHWKGHKGQTIAFLKDRRAHTCEKRCFICVWMIEKKSSQRSEKTFLSPFLLLWVLAQNPGLL
jgi:hypothetical protein